MFRRNTLMPPSRLYDQTDFYRKFGQDLRSAKQRVIIESPFITTRRSMYILPYFEAAMKRGATIVLNTRVPHEHGMQMRLQSQECIELLQELGVTVLFTKGLHRKIAIVDDIVWEGSLNILSQSDSCEVMRRTDSPGYTQELIRFTKLTKWYNQA